MSVICWIASSACICLMPWPYFFLLQLHSVAWCLSCHRHPLQCAAPLFSSTPRPATPQACSDTSKTACVASLHVGHMIPAKTLEAVEQRVDRRGHCVVSRNKIAHTHTCWKKASRIVILSLTLQVNFILRSNHPPLSQTISARSLH